MFEINLKDRRKKPYMNISLKESVKLMMLRILLTGLSTKSSMNLIQRGLIFILTFSKIENKTYLVKLQKQVQDGNGK